MNFRTFCDNKGCKKEMSPVVDKVTLDAYCTECGNKINTVSLFMRRQLVATGNVKRDEVKKLAWSVKCPNCQKESPPTLSKDNKTLLCHYCQKELTNISKPFAQTIFQNLIAKKRSGQ